MRNLRDVDQLTNYLIDHIWPLKNKTKTEPNWYGSMKQNLDFYRDLGMHPGDNNYCIQHKKLYKFWNLYSLGKIFLWSKLVGHVGLFRLDAFVKIFTLHLHCRSNNKGRELNPDAMMAKDFISILQANDEQLSVLVSS